MVAVCFQAGHIPSWRGSYERYALSPVAAARCSRQSGELEGRSSAWLPAWLPAAHDTGHRDALVLVTNIGPSTGAGTACPAVPRPLPRTRLLPDLVTDGFGQARLRVYMSHAA